MITKEELYARLNEEREDVNQDITVSYINYPFNFLISVQVGLMLLTYLFYDGSIFLKSKILWLLPLI